jgi:hypothetical protein
VLSWAGFKGAVTYTFDDANASQIQHYGELNGMGVPLTFFLIISKTEASDPIWKQALKDGHEVSNHNKSHLQIGTGVDIDAATSFLMQTLGVTAYDMAAPFGDLSYQPPAMTRFLLNRGVSDCLIGSGTADNTDPYNLCCYIAPTGSARQIPVRVGPGRHGHPARPDHRLERPRLLRDRAGRRRRHRRTVSRRFRAPAR